MKRRGLFFAIVLAGLTAVVLPVSGAATRAEAEPGNYIVMLDSGIDPVVHARGKGIASGHTYHSVFRGYSAVLSSDQVQSLRNDSAVKSVEKSRIFSRGAFSATTAATPKVPPQEPARALRRIGGLQSPTARIDGIDQRVDVDVAILDGGIQPDHPDLNVVGGRNCIPQGKASDWRDRDGHGTGVAGIVAALDNKFGRVGVAPGARLWAVRVGDPRGFIEDSELICGLEWLVAGGVDIEVANLSLSGVSIDPIRACNTDRANWDALQSAICAVVDAGVTIVAAAGNEGYDASTEVPAAYPDVIAVSAFSETDGLPGGLGASSASFGCEVDIADDTFAFFSNFGPVVDLSAGGVCVGTTWLNGTYAGGTGTSFSTPFVSGAAALYMATHPSADPKSVRQALLSQRERGHIAGDPDGIDEGIVNVSRL